MTMFNRAVLVVAPHGAGLFNTIFVYNMTIRHGLRYELFDDQNLPGLEDTMTMSNRVYWW